MGGTAEPTADEVCSFLARELRSPLATITGYLDLLANGGVGTLTVEQREFLDVVSRNVDRLTGVVTDWYELSRLDAGRVALTLEPVDLEEIADRAVTTLRPRIRGKAQQIAIEVASPDCFAMGDARALLQVVGNLLSNAHKYTPRGGSIRVSIEGSGETVRLDVVDTGIGIRDDDRHHLFRTFFRASLTDAEPGSGLGLSLVQALVERMGGTVEVQSVLGLGSTFSVTLPAASADAAHSQTASGMPAAPRCT